MKQTFACPTCGSSLFSSHGPSLDESIIRCKGHCISSSYPAKYTGCRYKAACLHEDHWFHEATTKAEARLLHELAMFTRNQRARS